MFLRWCAPIPVNGQGHGETQMIAFHSLVHEIVDLQDPQGVGVDQESQVLDEMGPSSVRCEIDHYHFLPFVLIQEEGGILDDPKHLTLFFPVLLQMSLDRREAGDLVDRIDLEDAEPGSHVRSLGPPRRGNGSSVCSRSLLPGVSFRQSSIDVYAKLSMTSASSTACTK